MNSREGNMTLFTPFWPLCLMAGSLAAFLGWQVTVAVRQYVTFLRLADQQALLSEQAVQAEGKLQAMMMDLLALSRTDADARAIVRKYGIRFNPAPAPVPMILPVSGPSRSRSAETAASGTWINDDAPLGRQE